MAPPPGWHTAAMRPLPLLLLCVLLLPACASLGSLGLERPTASSPSSSLTGVDAEGFDLDFGVDLANPNAVDLPLTDARYGLTLAGVDALEGEARPGGVLPAGGTARVRFPVRVRWETLAELGEALAASGGRVPYGLDASLGAGSASGLGAALGGAGGALRVPLRFDGELDLPALLRDPATLRSPVARRLAARLLGGALGF